MSARTSLSSIAKMALDLAQKQGVKDVRAVTHRARSVSVTYRDGRPDKVEESTRQGMTLQLYDEGRYSACDTNDLRPDAISAFMDRAVDLTRVMIPDEFRQITDPSLYAGRADVELGIYDPSMGAVGPQRRHELARTAQEAAMDAAGDRAISAEATFEDEQEEVYRLHSNGFEGSERGSQAWLVAEVSVKDDGDRRPSGWDIFGSRHLDKVDDAAAVGVGAARRASLRLGAVKGSTAVMPVIIENRSVGRFMGSLLAAATGRSIQQKVSFLGGKEGSQVGSSLLHLSDDPFLYGGFGSRVFDSEGIAARRFNVFEKGLLTNIYADTYYAKKLGRAPSTGGRSNLLMATGERSLADLARQVGDGLLVRGFVGGNSNPTTGDFSLGVYGTLIDGGVPGQAVMEMNISGNHQEVWKRLSAVGNDTWKYGTLLVPSLVFDGLQVSGN